VDSGGSDVVIFILVLYYDADYKYNDFNYGCHFDENVHWSGELPFFPVEDELVGLLDSFIVFLLFSL